MDHLQMEMDQDPSRTASLQAIESHTQQYIQSLESLKTAPPVYTIPVVVHVVYNTSTQNISNAQIQSQIDVLNDDFRRMNNDAVNTPSTFVGVAADAEIEFCLASVDPSGNATTGIIRKSTSVSSFNTNDNMKFNSSGGSSAWPSSDYLNIWVCRLSGGVLGYAQFPGGSSSTDGVVIDYRYFGTTGTVSSPFDEGRTTTHEVGHWLNLYHIWGDAFCGNDYVNDTPQHSGPHYGCPNHPNSSCGSVDMFMNYMDYSDDDCMNLFTTGQKNRMRALFSGGGARASILSSNGCGNGTSPTCNTPASLSTSNVTSSQATLNWGSVSGANSYNVRARATGSSSWATGSTSGTSINFTNLSSCTDYEFQVEAVCTGATSGYSNSHVFTSGGCTANCTIPANLNATNVTASDADLNWDAVAGATSYNIRAKQTSSSSWATGSTSNTTISFTGLSSCTDYEFQVEAVCASSNSGYSSSATFTSSGCTASCTAPTNLQSTNVTSTSFTATWNVVSGATQYQLAGRAVGNSGWAIFNVNTNSFNAGLSPNKTYEWGVRAYCPASGYTAWTGPVQFSTPPGANERFVEDQFDADSEFEFSVFPNPASDFINVDWMDTPGSPETTFVEIYNTLGERVIYRSVESAHNLKIELNDLAKGRYIIRLVSGDQTGQQSFIIP